MNDDTNFEQSIRDFTPGQRVRVRNNTFTTGDYTGKDVTPGEIVTVKGVQPMSAMAGTITLVERDNTATNQPGPAGSFGHLMFDPAPIDDAPTTYKVGDRVVARRHFPGNDITVIPHLTPGDTYVVTSVEPYPYTDSCPHLVGTQLMRVDTAAPGTSTNFNSLWFDPESAEDTSDSPAPQEATMPTPTPRIPDDLTGRDQRIEHFTAGQRVRVRDNSFSRGSGLDIGGEYVVASVHARPGGHAGALMIEGQDSGELESGYRPAGAFGHLLFEPLPIDAPIDDIPTEDDGPTFTVGQRVEVVGWNHDGSDTTEWNGPATVTVIESRYIIVNSDSAGRQGVFEPKYLRPLVEKADDAPDLANKAVRTALPMQEAYPVGSVWNHISTGDAPVTITGYRGSDRVRVSHPAHLSRGGIQHDAYAGEWIRGAFDSYGTLVSLPDAAPVEDTLSGHALTAMVAELEALRVENECLKALHADEVDALKAERATLTQAASDERRRLCAEIDDLKMSNVELHRDRAAAERALVIAENALDYTLDHLIAANDFKARLEGFKDGVAREYDFRQDS